MKVLFLLPEGGYGGAARQASLVAAGLPRDRFEVQVGILGRDGPMAERLRSSGLAVEVLGWTRLIDPQPVWRLRQLLRSFRPDVLAAWGLAGLRVGSLLRGPARLVLHQPLPPRERRQRPELGLIDRGLLRRADRLVARHAGEFHAYQRLGLPTESICLIPPGVAPAEALPASREELLRGRKLPATTRLLVCVGPLDPHKGYRDAVWALDILKYLYDDLHLVVLGDGPDRPRLESFARDIQVQDRVHFLGGREDVVAWLAIAEVVWVPSRTDGGVNVALEAMRAGRPVVAGRTPGLAEVVADGETGYLVAPGDKVGLARQTRLLLEDAGLRQRLGEAGRKRAEERFAAAELVRRWVEMMDGIFSPA